MLPEGFFGVERYAATVTDLEFGARHLCNVICCVLSCIWWFEREANYMTWTDSR